MAATLSHPLNQDSNDAAVQQESVKSTSKNWSSCGRMIRDILFFVDVSIVGCELMVFGFERIEKIPSDANFYQYRYLGYVLVIGLGILAIFSIIFWPLNRLLGRRQDPRVVVLLQNYWRGDGQSLTSAWWKRKWISRSVTVIGALICLLVFFQICHQFYLNVDYADRAQVRSSTYYAVGLSAVVIWSMFFVLFLIAVIYVTSLD